MGVFKEQAHILESIESRQHKIWSDSLDIGVSFSELSEGEVTDIRQTIKMLLDLPGSEIIFKANKPAVQRQYKLIIMWGAADLDAYDASRYLVSYYKDRNEEFVSVFGNHVFTDSNGNVI